MDTNVERLTLLKQLALRLKDEGSPIALLIEWALDELAEHNHSFEIRWKADMRAIKRWQAAHPGNDLTWPDHADLVVWLLEQLEEANEKGQA